MNAKLTQTYIVARARLDAAAQNKEEGADTLEYALMAGLGVAIAAVITVAVKGGVTKALTGL